MLEAVDFIHSQRVIHSDLKPANFLFVKGELKLIDFGIARSMNSDTTNIQVAMLLLLLLLLMLLLVVVVGLTRRKCSGTMRLER